MLGALSTLNTFAKCLGWLERNSAVVDASFRSLAVATHSATGAVGSLPGPWELGPR